MKTQSLILALTFVFIAHLSFSQGYTFKVLANKGANEVKKNGQWTTLKTGTLLDSNDEIKVADNAYIGLIHSSGKTLELKSAGSHKISDLDGKIDKQGSSVASKYADYVLSKMSAEGKKNRMKATGAVTREVGGKNLNVYIPNTVGVFTEKPILQWNGIEGDNVTYQLRVTNMFEDELMTAETNETSFQIDMNDQRLANENIVLVKITAGEEFESDTYALKRLPASDAQKVEATVSELMSGVEEETALTKYILAGYYEENNLLVDALTNYIEAMALAPEVDSFKEAYEEFLFRNRLNQ